MKKRWRHTAAFNFFRGFFKLYLKIRFNYTPVPFKAPDGIKGPYLILSNHALAIDPFLLGTSFRFPIFFVASDVIFAMPFWTPIIKFLVSPIPKTKYRSDTETVRDIVKMVRSGGSIGIFPEGNATFSGRTTPMPFAIAKLVKLLKVPVLFYRLEGGYLSKPRWARHVRKGKMTGRVVNILEPETFRDMDAEEIFDIIEKTLFFDIFEQQKFKPVRYLGKSLAEDVESAYFHCPNCGRFETLVSIKDTVSCKMCPLKLAFTPLGTFEPLVDGLTYYETTVEWHDAQERALAVALAKTEGVVFEDRGETVYEVPRSQSKKRIGKALLRLTATTVDVAFDEGSSKTWPVDDVLASVQQKNWLILYVKSEQKTYFFIGSKKRNALKYVMALEALKRGDAS